MAGEVTITISASDMSQDQLDRLAQRIGRVDEAGKRASQSAIQWGRAVQGATNMIERGMGIMTRLDLVQITVQQSAERAQHAQESYTKAIQEFGPHSEQAAAAARELANANQSGEKANLRARLSYVLIVGDVVTMAVQIPRAVTALRTLTVTMTAAAGAGAVMTTVLTAGLAAVGIIAGLAAVNSAMSKNTAEISIYSMTLDQLNKKRTDTYNKLAESEAKVAGVEKESPISPSRLLDLEAVRHTRQKIRDEHARLAEEVKGIDAEIAKVQQQQADEIAKAKADAEKKAADEARAAWTEANEGIVNSLRGGLSQMGVDLNNFGAANLRSILDAAGVAGEFSDKLLAAKAAEEQMITAALQSSEALRNQATVTRRKGETTEQFRQRLLSLGYAEDQIAGKVDDTTQSFSLQSKATETAGTAAAGYTGGILGSMGGPLGSQGAEMAQGSRTMDPGSVDLNSRTERFQQGATKAASEVQVLYEELQLLLARNPGAMSHPEVAGYRRLLEAQLRGANPYPFTGKYRDRALKFLTAASGFEGIVSQPTLILAGEGGAKENVSITPQGKSGGFGGNQPVNVNVYLPKGEGNEEGVRRGVMRALGTSERRIAQRRTF